MMRVRVLASVATSTFREFWRTREAVFWSYAFPLLMAVVLGFAFGRERREALRVAVVGDGAPAAWAEVLGGDGRLVVQPADAATAREHLVLGRVDVVVREGAGGPVLELDPTRPDAELAELLVRDRLQRAAGRREPLPVQRVEVVEAGARYIDFLIPGLVALNLLGMGMFGVGFNLVHMRVERLLRRLLVTPMSRTEFLVGFLVSRFVLSLPSAAVVVVFGMAAFGVPVRGSWLALTLILVAGGAALSGLGVLVASRVQTMEGAGGVINLVQLPLWLMGGVFFSNERFPEAVQPLVRALPTTQISDALRAVMLQGHGVADVLAPVLALVLCAVLCLAAGVRIFRW